MELIKDVTNNTIMLRFIEHDGKKFRLTYDNRSGTVVGFDHRFKAEILKDWVWETIACKEDIGFDQISPLRNKNDRIEDSKKFFNAMEKHIGLLV